MEMHIDRSTDLFELSYNSTMSNILVVDDEQAVLHIARLTLERACHQVVTGNPARRLSRKLRKWIISMRSLSITSCQQIGAGRSLPGCPLCIQP